MEPTTRKELYRVPITWHETGTVYVEASSPEDAIKHVEQRQLSGNHGQLVKGSVKVIAPEKVISDREYRRPNGPGPKLHLITGHDAGKVHTYLEVIKRQATAENKTITSNIEGFTNIPKEGFESRRLQILLSPETLENLFGYDEIVADGNELYVFGENGYLYTKEFIQMLKAMVWKGNILILEDTIPRGHDILKNIIYKLMWQYIHTFKEIYFYTVNDCSYTDYEDEVYTDFHFIENTGEAVELDLDTFEEKLIEVEANQEYQRRFHGVSQDKQIKLKRDMWFKTPAARTIPSVLADAIKDAAWSYFRDTPHAGQFTQFSLYTTDFEQGKVEVIEHQGTEPHRLEKMYFSIYDDQKDSWTGQVLIIKEHETLMMCVIENEEGAR